MSGLATLCNTGPLVEAGGRFLRVKGRTLLHLGEAEAQVLFLRGDLSFYLRSAVSHMKKEDAKAVIITVLQKIRGRWIGCNSEDIHRFYSTLEGRVFSFYQSVRENGLTYEECRDIYFEESQASESWESDIKWSIETASGEADLNKLYMICGLHRTKSKEDDDYLIDRSSLFSSLFREPFGYKPDEVSQMTLGQISLILPGCESSREDVKSESGLRKQKRTPGIRKMLEGYDRAYSEIADNIVNGLSFTSSLRKP